MHNYCFCCELVLGLSWVPLKRIRAKLHIDAKNKSEGADKLVEIWSNFQTHVANAIFELGANQ